MADIRGNWWPTRLWGALTSATAYGLLFLTVSGVYIWLVLGLPRRTGYILAAAGGLVIFILIGLMV